MEWRRKRTDTVREIAQETIMGWEPYVSGDRKSVLRAMTDLAAIDKQLLAGERLPRTILRQGDEASDFLSAQSPQLIDEMLETIGLVGGTEVRTQTKGVIARMAVSTAISAGLFISVAPTEAAAVGNGNADTRNVADKANNLEPSLDDNGPLKKWQIERIQKEVRAIEKRQATSNATDSKREPSPDDNDPLPWQIEEIGKEARNIEKRQATPEVPELPGVEPVTSGNTEPVWKQKPGHIERFLNFVSKPNLERAQEKTKEGDYKSLLDFIAKFESSKDYNAYWHDPDFDDLEDISFTDMTIGEVQAWQKAYHARGSYSTAVGRYQLIMKTFDGLVREMKLDKNTKFDEATQDQMGVQLLKRRGLNAYMKGRLSDKEFAHKLSQEWAALPNVIGKNVKGDKVPPHVSYYNDDNFNQAGVSVDATLDAVRSIKKSHKSKPVVDDHEPAGDTPLQIDDQLTEPMGEVGELLDTLNDTVEEGAGEIGQLLASIGQKAVKSSTGNEIKWDGDCPDGTEFVKGIKGSIELCAIEGTEVVYNSASKHWKDKRYGGTTAAGEKRLAVNAEIADDARRMVEAALADGITLKVTIGYRTEEEQCSIFIRNHSRPEVCEAWITPVRGNWKTTTMKSNHMDGKSFDVHDAATLKWMRKNGHKFNFIDDVYRAEGWDAKHWTWKRGVSA